MYDDYDYDYGDSFYSVFPKIAKKKKIKLVWMKLILNYRENTIDR